MTPVGIINLLQRARLDLSDEKTTQREMADIFYRAGVVHEREVRLSPRDIPDFMIGDIAVEVKLKGARKMDIYKQLKRYAGHERVNHIILATNITMGLPEEIEGKSVYFVGLGQAWL